jgi:hypothetical protein
VHIVGYFYYDTFEYLYESVFNKIQLQEHILITEDIFTNLQVISMSS